jgi:hypothetical protein
MRKETERSSGRKTKLKPSQNTHAQHTTKRAKQRKLASRRETRSVFFKKEKKKELAKNFRQIST